MEYRKSGNNGLKVSEMGNPQNNKNTWLEAVDAGMGGTESQVKGHILGNVKVGNDKETLLSVTTQLLPYIRYPRTLNALKCLNEVIPE